MRAESIAGCVLGTAAGDSIGLPYEALPPRVRGVTAHRLLFGRGMTSDDTEHTCIVAHALIRSAGKPAAFQREMARGLRRWLCTVPPGTGLATLRATLKLSVGFGPQTSGVCSAGNGPAMRSALIGVCHGGNSALLRQLVRISTRITHTDARAEHAALAVSIAAHVSAREATVSAGGYYRLVATALAGENRAFLERLQGAVDSVTAGEPTTTFARTSCSRRGPSGYCLESVPVALHAWLRHPEDFRAAITSLLDAGGDTDTMAAIAGGIIGARVGTAGIPSEWLDGLWEWPASVRWMRSLAGTLAEVVESGQARDSRYPAWAALLARNAFFTGVVLTHGFRRLLP